ncbi:hypothetical protein [Thiomicrospira microaerophila]|uniref:hypothetical protein n=1 Tax=Thiomicrospira microaerophila TaxID=406020 RepID=UPI0005CAC00D|nr:hypothetical protein [Thiomicrospira microaerophila]
MNRALFGELAELLSIFENGIQESFHMHNTNMIASRNSYCMSDTIKKQIVDLNNDAIAYNLALLNRHFVSLKQGVQDCINLVPDLPKN